VDDETVDREDDGRSPFVDMEGGETDPGVGTNPGGDMMSSYGSLGLRPLLGLPRFAKSFGHL